MEKGGTFCLKRATFQQITWDTKATEEVAALAPRQCLKKKLFLTHWSMFKRESEFDVTYEKKNRMKNGPIVVFILFLKLASR